VTSFSLQCGQTIKYYFFDTRRFDKLKSIRRTNAISDCDSIENITFLIIYVGIVLLLHMLNLFSRRYYFYNIIRIRSLIVFRTYRKRYRHFHVTSIISKRIKNNNKKKIIITCIMSDSTIIIIFVTITNHYNRSARTVHTIQIVIILYWPKKRLIFFPAVSIFYKCV